ncbi:UDP-N-acetylmuramate--L-alanine ligase [Jonesia quinghaiensis]|uniref:UDP-N-acetylmuramate--L-alanine ligase n=1 Tax=Jonesia quinghaiensis TaxID=262806 RepID=UPI0004104CEC|nr:UDP-N-acetylmuramate--L-alanine ligase [Jonesia quinghaiensis]
MTASARWDALTSHDTAISLSPVHFIGVGGAGMSVLAHMFRASGAAVTGSDAKASATTQRLEQEGVAVDVPHNSASIVPGMTVVVSSAIREDNPELMRARELRVRVIHRSQALAVLMRGRQGVAVAGAHGKTTTSGMIAVAAQACGLDPSFAVGSTVRTAHGVLPGGYVGSGQLLVAEADESDGSFLNYEPQIAVVTNIEPDHLDHYGSREAFDEAFESFAGNIAPDGWLVACTDDEGALALAEKHSRRGGKTLTYGDNESCDARLIEVINEGLGQRVVVTLAARALRAISGSQTAQRRTVELALQVPGHHNALNATAALLVLVAAGVEPQRAADALGSFSGTGRRFDSRGSVRGVQVVDDYAHHPTEVAALLAAARTVTKGRVIAIFQPHLYSRTRIFAKEFAAALSSADHVVLTAIYGAREEPEPGVSSDLIASAMDPAMVTVLEDRYSAARYAADIAQPGDLVLTVGAGDITEMGEVIVARLTGAA